MNTKNECQKLLDRALAIINDAILHGMPVTEEVAEVSNLIRGTKYSRSEGQSVERQQSPGRDG